MADLARVGEGFAAAAAVRTRLLHGEDATLHAHLATAVAGGAGIELAIFRTGAVARLAGGQRGQFDALLDAGDGLLEIELHHIAHVRAAARTARGAAAKDVAENVAENVADVVEARSGIATAHSVFERGMPVLVVHAAFAAVGQHFVGFLALLELLERIGIRGIAVRVVLHRAAAIGLLQLVLGRVACDAEDLVVIALAHRRLLICNLPSSTQRAGPACPLSAAIVDQACLSSSFTSVNTASTTS